MFYVEKYLRNNQRERVLTHIVPAVVVFIAFFGISIWSARSAMISSQHSQAAIAKSKADTLEQTIQTRVDAYGTVLRAAVGLFNNSPSVNRDQWKSFVDNFQLAKQYPGIRGLGYAPVVDNADATDFQASVAANDLSSFAIYPSGQRNFYIPVLYFEQVMPNTPSAIGYDMYSDPTRSAALIASVKSGSPTIAGPLVLQQDSGPAQTGFLLYMPIYQPGANTATDLSGVQGFVYAGMKANDFFTSSGIATDQQSAFRINNIHGTSSTPIYQTTNYQSLSKQHNIQTYTHTFQLDNATWSISSVVTPRALTIYDQQHPMDIFWSGLIFSLFIAGFVYLLLVNRTAAIATKEEGRVREAKDELLALASHQLRTPATGVKQYVGMVQEGFAGPLNKDQRNLLEKAYESNERQLNIINEILVIAKADAGNLTVNLQRTNIVSLLHNIVDEHQDEIDEHHLVLTQNIPKRAVYIEADPQYIQMAIENILSNAIKYTPEGGKISIALKRRKRSAQITVADTGVGVSPKDFPLLFRKFSRIPNDLTSKVSGSGIGLYLAKKVVDEHHGSIRFESAIGEGSTCVMSLPLHNE